MASHNYTATASGSISASANKTFTTGAFSVPSGESFVRYKISKSTSTILNLLRYNSSTQGMSWDTWYTDTSWIAWSSGNGAKISVVNASTSAVNNVTYTVTFETSDNTYSITCNVSPSGTGTLTASPSSAVKNTTVTLTPTPAQGYKFVDYTSSVTITDNQFTMPIGNVSVTANFAKAYKTVKVYNGEAFVKCTMNYYDGTKFVECEPSYYDGTAWQPCNQEDT